MSVDFGHIERELRAFAGSCEGDKEVQADLRKILSRSFADARVEANGYPRPTPGPSGKEGWVYLLRSRCGRLHKVGATVKSPSVRACSYGSHGVKWVVVAKVRRSDCYATEDFLKRILRFELYALRLTSERFVWSRRMIQIWRQEDETVNRLGGLFPAEDVVWFREPNTRIGEVTA